jgi:hypothetical protein
LLFLEDAEDAIKHVSKKLHICMIAIVENSPIAIPLLLSVEVEFNLLKI